MIDKTLGHYQITSQPGKGGMGEVFPAKDLKLGQAASSDELWREQVWRCCPKLIPKHFAICCLR
jgi:hypothetical protein